MLVELDELPELLEFPEAFRGLGGAVCGHRPHGGGPEEWQHWLAVVPGRREMVAARLLNDLADCAVGEARGEAAILPLLAEAEGEAGDAVHLCVAYALAAGLPEDRLAAVYALLVLAAQGRLDGGRLGEIIGEPTGDGVLKAQRLTEALRAVAASGAYRTVWSVLRAALPVLMEAHAPGAGRTSKVRGLGDLLDLGADCVERCGAREEVPGLAELRTGRGPRGRRPGPVGCAPRWNWAAAADLGGRLPHEG